MPASKTKAAPTNGAAPKAKGSKSTPASTGTSTPVPTSTPLDTSDQVTATGGFGKPEKAVYDAEQDRIKAEIDNIQAKLVCTLLYVLSATLNSVSL
jgi:hypothetical protein